VCGGATEPAGSKQGAFQKREFFLRHCPACRFSFVADPWTDYAAIYSEAYYSGRGADPLVDYVFELEHPDETIRQYEWRGVVRAVGSLRTLDEGSRWLDFGCGNGGLVRYIREQGVSDAVGFEEGWIADRARAAGIPILAPAGLDPLAGTFDVVTAIEVLEHVERPCDVLRRIRGLLKPGGLFFFTTGNARPARGRLSTWGYVRPEIHISFFEPETAARALESGGFTPEFRGFLPGFDDIIRFKALKNLGISRQAAWQGLLPWTLMARLLDARMGITAHPVGWNRSTLPSRVAPPCG
jgi:SAM-dependent methyltransferase